MNKFLATFKLTYLNKIKAKSFMISTVIFMLIIMAIANADKIIDMFDGGKDKIGIATTNTQLYEQVKTTSEKLHKDVIYVKTNPDVVDQALKDEKIDQAYVIKEQNDQIVATIKSTDEPGQQDQAELQTLLTQIQSQQAAQDIGLSQDEQKRLLTPSKVDTQVVSANGNSDVSANEELFSTIIVMVGSFLMVFIIFGYANQIAMEVATEKTSRVSEMIITSIKPSYHILAKIMAVLSVALTQMVIYAITVVACIFIFDLGDTLKGWDLELTPHITRLIVFGVIFLILGIFTYVVLAAILGNLTARIEDMAQSLMPLTILMFASFYTGYFGASTNPDHILIRITSYVPFFSPFVTFARLSLPDTPTMEGVIAIVIHLVLIAVLLYFATRTYRNAVLTFEKGWVKSLKRAFQKSA